MQTFMIELRDEMRVRFKYDIFSFITSLHPVEGRTYSELFCVLVDLRGFGERDDRIVHLLIRLHALFVVQV